jgi:hypothetical protein
MYQIGYDGIEVLDKLYMAPIYKNYVLYKISKPET